VQFTSERNYPLLADSYKLAHWMMLPPETEHVYSYYEARYVSPDFHGFQHSAFLLLQYYLMDYLEGVRVNHDDIAFAQDFTRRHLGRDVFNLDGWRHIVDQHGGCLPISIKAVPEGSVVGLHNVLMSVLNTDPQRTAFLGGFLETLLSKMWYPGAVGTLAWGLKRLIAPYLDRTGSLENLDAALHDFGYRGASSEESAAIGGCAHLASFYGTDNTAGLLLAHRIYGDPNATEKPMYAKSVVATEHSVMIVRGEEGEPEVLDQLLEQFPSGPLSVVGDSYDIQRFILTHLRERRERILARDGVFITRPDSGDPPIMMQETLKNLSDVFGSTANAKNYLELPPQVRALPGDGNRYATIRQILEVMVLSRWSANNIATFGMGGGLLQMLNRDSLGYAFKPSEAIIGGKPHPIFKNPKTDPSKTSKAGRLKLIEEEGNNGPIYRTVAAQAEPEHDDALVEVFRDGKILQHYTFDEVRERMSRFAHI
jgi:nicotinamide phosphoribosyltransferase